MANISAMDVKTLRESTGAGMMDCKNALNEAEGDAARAVEILRERGLSKAGKRAGRETAEGAVSVAVAGPLGALVELGCETDFVAKTDDFQALAQEVADIVVGDADLLDVEKALAAKHGEGSVDDAIKAASARMGEHIELKRLARVDAGSGLASGYIHAGGKLGVVVALATSKDEATLTPIARDLAMHVAAVDPTPVAIDRAGVPEELVASEKAILRTQALDSGKPENIVEKIVDGRINKFYAENCLLEQAFVKDPDTTVGKMLKAVDPQTSVSAFVRFKLGEAS